MKKSHVVLALCMALALNTVKTYTSDNEVSMESKQTAQDSAPSSVEADFKIGQELNNILETDEEQLAEKIDQIALVFEVKRDQDCDRQAWQRVVKRTADLVKQCASTRSEDTLQLTSDIRSSMEMIMNECGEQSAIHGRISISLGRAEDTESQEQGDTHLDSQECQDSCTSN